MEEKTSAGALASAQTIIDETVKELHDLQAQAGAPDDRLLHLSTLSPPTPPIATSGSSVRVLGAFGAIGVFLAVGVAFGAEALSSERARRRAPDATSYTHPETTERGTSPDGAEDRVDAPLVVRRLVPATSNGAPPGTGKPAASGRRGGKPAR